jgi:hypothetical protein
MLTDGPHFICMYNYKVTLSNVTHATEGMYYEVDGEI